MLIKKFEEQVEKTPANIALKEGTQEFTYKELNRYANRIARRIAAMKTGENVGLLLEHGIPMIAGILAALKAGKVYIPMAVDYPPNRLSYMLKNSESTMIITMNTNRELAADLAREQNLPVCYIDGMEKEEEGDADENPRNKNSGDKTAYILYTSGSTGKPKGVYQTHRNADYYCRNWIRVFSITAADRMTLFSSFCHDGSVQDMFSALHTGATLYPMNIKNRENTFQLAEYLEKEQLTIWHSVPSLFSYFANTLTGEEDFSQIRYILLGGEAVRGHE
ncbi:MAG: amino acid adenylation domain-containing protein, partial [bacterium]|nr:amino acid adenylation domain-containing protein [bacterium]